MKVLLSIFLAGLVLAGCGSTERISRSHLKVRAFEVNIAGLRGPVSVTGTDGRISSAVAHFNILGDSAMWIEPESETAVTMPTMQIERFTIKDRVAGSVWGMTIGAGVGALAGTLMEPDNNGGLWMPLGLVTGEVLGFVIGTMIGVNDHYIIGP